MYNFAYKFENSDIIKLNFSLSERKLYTLLQQLMKLTYNRKTVTVDYSVTGKNRYSRNELQTSVREGAGGATTLRLCFKL